MATRKGVFIGAYVPPSTKQFAQAEAERNHRTLSQQVQRLLDLFERGDLVDVTDPDGLCPTCGGQKGIHPARMLRACQLKERERRDAGRDA